MDLDLKAILKTFAQTNSWPEKIQRGGVIEFWPNAIKAEKGYHVTADKTDRVRVEVVRLSQYRNQPAALGELNKMIAYRTRPDTGVNRNTLAEIHDITYHLVM